MDPKNIKIQTWPLLVFLIIVVASFLHYWLGSSLSTTFHPRKLFGSPCKVVGHHFALVATYVVVWFSKLLFIKLFSPAYLCHPCNCLFVPPPQQNAMLNNNKLVVGASLWMLCNLFPNVVSMLTLKEVARRLQRCYIKKKIVLDWKLPRIAMKGFVEVQMCTQRPQKSYICKLSIFPLVFDNFFCIFVLCNYREDYYNFWISMVLMSMGGFWGEN